MCQGSSYFFIVTPFVFSDGVVLGRDFRILSTRSSKGCISVSSGTAASQAFDLSIQGGRGRRGDLWESQGEPDYTGSARAAKVT